MTYLSEVRVLLATLPAIPRADHTLVYLIVAAFLAITLLIGLRAGRGIKTLKEYAVANKTYGTVALVLTYLATEIGGGSILGDVKEVFTQGIL